MKGNGDGTSAWAGLVGSCCGTPYATVNGSLVANGTAGSPVTFTSFRDHSVGGGTNGDAKTSSRRRVTGWDQRGQVGRRCRLMR